MASSVQPAPRWATPTPWGRSIRSLTLDALFASLPAGSIGRETTIDQIIQAMLPLADYPWEQIKVQGLQDVAGTGQNVRYHVDFDLDCSIATSFSVHVKLPDGFFPVSGSSAFSYAGGMPQAAANPAAGSNGPVWTKLPGSPCGGTTLTRHVRLDFSSFAGLTLGSQSSSVDVTAVGTYSASDQAPVLVTQNWEPSDDPATAPAIEKNSLVVGHIASSGDVDYFRFPLTGLAPGTKVAAYLKVPEGADLDLALNKPSAPTIQPNPAGSIPAGSIAIEDSSPGMDNSRGALPPNTLADIPAGSIPAGSIPAGSIPAGSISANRGAVNESAQIVTRGETGTAYIGVSGYNGAFSNGNYVLRIKVTPPPTLPTCPAKTGLAPTLATPSTLPVSLPASTKALFLVNRQRLAGLYDATRMNALLNSSALASVATGVGGAVVPVDGSTAVKAAYAAWDANPCAPEAANDVVRAINGVVANYRATLPNLKYVVLLGTDQAIPMYRQPDLTALSPEIDNAQELAFTTNGLTQGNSTYASAALNRVLTDGAYGAFARTIMLGQDLPLPQVSVSRLVETPEDIQGQFQQFIDSSGVLDIHSALTTGDDFFVDGAQATSDALSAQFPSLSSETLVPPTSFWTSQDLRDRFFHKTGGVPDAGALYAHYNHWLAQPASIPLSPILDDFATTADVGAAVAAPVHDRLSRRPQPARHGRRPGERRRPEAAAGLGAGLRPDADHSDSVGTGGGLRRQHRLRLWRHEDGRPLREADGPVRKEPEHRRHDRRAVGSCVAHLLPAGRRLRRRRSEGDGRGDDVRAPVLRIHEPRHGAYAPDPADDPPRRFARDRLAAGDHREHHRP